MRKLVAYYRVSTKRQGESGLGLEGQEDAVRRHAAATDSTLIASYTDIETGKRADRPELALALSHAKAANATVCIAKLDRLARNVAFLSGLMESRVPFECCDNPHATPLTIHILAAVAEDEAKRISERTKTALRAYKEGKRVSRRTRALHPEGPPAELVAATAGKLGASLPQCRNLTPESRRRGQALGARAARALAAEHAAHLAPVVAGLRAEGRTYRAIAAELNARGFVTRRGGPWDHVAVLRAARRARA